MKKHDTAKSHESMARDGQVRVMVVDDDLHIHATLGIVLENAGYDHASVLPQKLEERLTTFQPAVIILDLSMPGFDGIEVLGLLRLHGFTGRVIVMSGRDRDVIETARRVGQSYGLRMGPGLQKPARARDILGAVRSEEEASSTPGAMSDIARGFASGEFRFHYQPKYDLRMHTLVGFESLVRWQHPDKGLLLPGAFLAQMNSGGFKSELARTALKNAVAQLEEWHELGATTNISINVALEDATDPSFLLQLTAAVNAMSSPPASLTIELLEGAADLDLNAAAAALTRVRLLGVNVSIDDFGMQSSSLARLQHLPANEIKIDRSFIATLRKFKQDEIIVRSVIGLARQLGLSAVAEGIEDHDTLCLLVEMGCVYGQGWHFAKAMPAEDASRLLQEQARRIDRRFAEN
jgi:EAL domain-containing protein (putative c-di-GMP-specific phosphodiesterase class I)/ActR/RegA family two-component response regulator